MGGDTSWKVGCSEWRIHSHNTKVAQKVDGWRGWFVSALYCLHSSVEAIDVAIPQCRCASACRAPELQVAPSYTEEQARGRKLATGFAREELQNGPSKRPQIDEPYLGKGSTGEKASQGLKRQVIGEAATA